MIRAPDANKLGKSWDPVNSIATLSQPGMFQTFDDLFNKKILLFITFPMFGCLYSCMTIHIKFIISRMLKRNPVVMDMLVRKMDFLTKKFMRIRSQLRRNEDRFGRIILKRQKQIIDTNIHENWEIHNVTDIKKY